MIDLVGVVNQIADFAPMSSIPLDLGVLPDLSQAGSLATSLGASAQSLLTSAEALFGDSAQLGSIVANVQPLFASAAQDIVGIGEAFLQAASAIMPRLLNPETSAQAQAELALLPGMFLTQAQQRTTQLEGELSGAVLGLNELAEKKDPVQTTNPAAVGPAHAGPGNAGPAHAGGPQAPPAGPQPPTQEPGPGGMPAGGAGPIPNDGNAAGKAAVAAAKSQMGVPYVWGGTTPGAGFDCSGLTQWAWGQAGVDLPRLAEHQNVGRQISASELQEGDLLVWDGHVAMYAGDGQIIEAGNPVGMSPVREDNIGMAFMGYYRPTG